MREDQSSPREMRPDCGSAPGPERQDVFPQGDAAPIAEPLSAVSPWYCARRLIAPGASRPGNGIARPTSLRRVSPTATLFVECKWSDQPIDKGIRYLKARFPATESWQVSATGVKDSQTPEGTRVAPVFKLLEKLV